MSVSDYSKKKSAPGKEDGAARSAQGESGAKKRRRRRRRRSGNAGESQPQ